MVKMQDVEATQHDETEGERYKDVSTTGCRGAAVAQALQLDAAGLARVLRLQALTQLRIMYTDNHNLTEPTWQLLHGSTPWCKPTMTYLLIIS